jgi:hypothetical protein
LILVWGRSRLSRHHFNFGAAFLVYDELAQVQAAIALIEMTLEIKIVSQGTRLDFREPHSGAAVGATRVIEMGVHVAPDHVSSSEVIRSLEFDAIAVGWRAGKMSQAHIVAPHPGVG